MDVLTVRDAVDTHVHSSPCLYGRVGSDWQIAVACRNAGQRAIVLKSHHEPTVTRAAMVNQRMRDEGYEGKFEVFGGVTLNTYVGGINPRAAEVALEHGGKIVWMPTVEAAYHGKLFGGFGGLTKGMQAAEQANFTGLTVEKDGHLIPEAVEIVKLVAAHNAVLAGAHVSDKEILLLAEACHTHGATFIVNHPFFMPRQKDFGYYRELAKLGAHFELCAVFCHPAWPYSNWEQNLEFIAEFGDDQTYLATDAGNPFTAWPHDALRVYIQNLHKLGLSQERIYKMMAKNPAKLLGIEL